MLSCNINTYYLVPNRSNHSFKLALLVCLYVYVPKFQDILNVNTLQRIKKA